jgi:hypothetical protein
MNGYNTTIYGGAGISLGLPDASGRGGGGLATVTTGRGGGGRNGWEGVSDSDDEA